MTEATSSKTEVVIAEDSRIQAKILQKRLVEAGYEVRHGENGVEALALIRQRRPQLIISDIEMPEMSGYELCRAVKNDADLKTIPLILLSTLSSPEDIIEGLQAGADNYVTKPYEAAYLLSRVASLLGTPIVDDGNDQQSLDVTLAGKRYVVKSGRQQVLNLLISTFENAVEKNNELVRVNQQLTVAKDQLTTWNEELETLNNQLESANTRMSRDLEAAAKVQQSLLPSTAPDVPEIRLAWSYIPCDELAGDFLNFFALDERHVAMFVVDVSGHGVASSLLAVTIARFLTPHVSASSLLVQPSSNGDRRIIPPAEVAYELNRRFPMEEQGELYFTMLYGILNTETRQLRYVSAGHDPPVHISGNSKPHFLKAEGMAIGWVDDMQFDEEVVTLDAGDRIFFYSDGVPEAMDPELNEFGNERMIEVISSTQCEPLTDSVEVLRDSVAKWCGNAGPKDDVSILALQVDS